MSTIQQRAKGPLSMGRSFGEPAELVDFDFSFLAPPQTEQHILRMMVQAPKSEGYLRIPAELEWLRRVITFCTIRQGRMEIHNQYIYVTVRHGIVRSVTDDLWHVDGFSMRTAHIPEQNYIWTSTSPTEVLDQSILLPPDFDPMRHNIHSYFQDVAKEENTKALESGALYCIDPYVIHRRPKIQADLWRTFFRVSFVPIEIEDDTCTINPLIPRARPYARADIRAQLSRYTPRQNYTSTP